MPTTVCNLTDDTYIRDVIPTTNSDADGHILCGWASGSLAYRSLLRFDLSAIPSGSNVSEALLKGNVNLQSGPAEPAKASRITASWAEAQATWNDRLTGTAWSTAGGDFTTPEVSFGLPTATGAWQLDVAPIVQQWINGVANYGLILWRTSESSPNAYIRCDDDEGVGTAYTLDVTYTVGVPMRLGVSGIAIGIGV